MVEIIDDEALCGGICGGGTIIMREIALEASDRFQGRQAFLGRTEIGRVVRVQLVKKKRNQCEDQVGIGPALGMKGVRMLGFRWSRQEDLHESCLKTTMLKWRSPNRRRKRTNAGFYIGNTHHLGER